MKISTGCENCYAIDQVAGLARKFKDTNPTAYAFYGDLTEKNNWTGIVKVHAEHLTIPLRWETGRRIFVNSLSDLFHVKLPNETIAGIFAIMAAAKIHTFKVLTKRADRMKEWFDWIAGEAKRMGMTPPELCFYYVGQILPKVNPKQEKMLRAGKSAAWPLPNVWMGCTVEDERANAARVPLLISIPAAVRFLSCEPLLGPINITNQPWWDWRYTYEMYKVLGMTKPPIHWVIVGGESGPKFRPMQTEWATEIRKQCEAAGVAFFFKQSAASKAGQNPFLPNEKGEPTEYKAFPA